MLEKNNTHDLDSVWEELDSVQMVYLC